MTTAGSDRCLSVALTDTAGIKQQQFVWFSQTEVQMTSAHCETFSSSVCAHACVCTCSACVAMHLSVCQLDIDWRSLDCVCRVVRGDKAEHSPGGAGCSLPACLPACTPRRRETIAANCSRQQGTAHTSVYNANKNCCLRKLLSWNVYCVFVSYKPLSPV